MKNNNPTRYKMAWLKSTTPRRGGSQKNPPQEARRSGGRHPPIPPPYAPASSFLVPRRVRMGAPVRIRLPPSRPSPAVRLSADPRMAYSSACGGWAARFRRGKARVGRAALSELSRAPPRARVRRPPEIRIEPRCASRESRKIPRVGSLACARGSCAG